MDVVRITLEKTKTILFYLRFLREKKISGKYKGTLWVLFSTKIAALIHILSETGLFCLVRKIRINSEPLQFCFTITSSVGVDLES